MGQKFKPCKLNLFVKYSIEIIFLETSKSLNIFKIKIKIPNNKIKIKIYKCY